MRTKLLLKYLKAHKHSRRAIKVSEPEAFETVTLWHLRVSSSHATVKGMSFPLLYFVSRGEWPTDGSKNESTEDRRCGAQRKNNYFTRARHSNWMHAGGRVRRQEWKTGEKVAVRGSFVWSRGEIETGGGESVSRRDSIFESSWWGDPARVQMTR